MSEMTLINQIENYLVDVERRFNVGVDLVAALVKLFEASS